MLVPNHAEPEDNALSGAFFPMPWWFFRRGYIPSSDFPRFVHYIRGEVGPSAGNSFGRGDRTIENVTKKNASETTRRQIVFTLEQAYVKWAPSVGDEFRTFVLATERTLATLYQISLTLEVVLAQTPFDEASARRVLEDPLLKRFCFFPLFRDQLLSAHTPKEFQQLAQSLTMLVVLVYLAIFESYSESLGRTPQFAQFLPRLDLHGAILRPMTRFFETALGQWINANFYSSSLRHMFQEDEWEAYRKQIGRWKKGSLPKNFYEFNKFVRLFDSMRAQHDSSHPAHNGAKVDYGGHIIAAYYVIRVLDKMATDCTTCYDIAVFGNFNELFSLYYEIFDYISERALA